VKVAKVEEPAAKKEEKRSSNTGAKSKILIEEVEGDSKPAPPAAEEPKKVKADQPAKPKEAPVKLAEKVEEIRKEESVVQKSEEIKPPAAVEGKKTSREVDFLKLFSRGKNSVLFINLP
jgi:hypothetical protein